MKKLLALFLLFGIVGCSSMNVENTILPETNKANYGAVMMKCMQATQIGQHYIEDNFTISKELQDQNDCVDSTVAKDEMALFLKSKKNKIILISKKQDKPMVSKLKKTSEDFDIIKTEKIINLNKIKQK